MPASRRRNRGNAKPAKKLSAEIWALLEHSAYPDPPSGDPLIFRIMALEHESRRDIPGFWARIKQAVLGGEIEVCDGVNHTTGDGARLLEGLD